MTHSIPDASAVAIGTELGTVLITGDYKFDQTPVDGVPADVSRLAELGAEGVLLLCGDSTNADRPGFSPSEATVGPEPRERLPALRGPDRRHVVRVEHPPRPAGRSTPPRRSGARSSLIGRSMRKNVNIGRTLGPHHRARGDARSRRARSTTGPTRSS